MVSVRHQMYVNVSRPMNVKEEDVKVYINKGKFNGFIENMYKIIQNKTFFKLYINTPNLLYSYSLNLGDIVSFNWF